MKKGKVGLCQIIRMTCFEVSPSDSPGATKEEPDYAVGKKRYAGIVKTEVTKGDELKLQPHSTQKEAGMCKWI